MDGPSFSRVPPHETKALIIINFSLISITIQAATLVYTVGFVLDSNSVKMLCIGEQV